MKIIIAGAGAVGTHLAKLLSREHHDITLMDESPEKLEDISSNFDILTLPLSPSSISALKEAEVGKADLLHRRHPRRSPQHDQLHAGLQAGRQENRGPSRQL